RRELFEDLEGAVKFSRTALFKKVYEEGYGRLGTPRLGYNEAYGLLVGDYEFGRDPDEMRLLRMIADVAAAAHVPFVAGASPQLFDCARFADLSASRNLSGTFAGAGCAPWKAFRESASARYGALTLPRVLARLPYGAKFKRVDEFDFEEEVDGANHDTYLWMSAAWAYAARVTDAFARYNWLARTCGPEGGAVQDLPVHTFPTDD